MKHRAGGALGERRRGSVGLCGREHEGPQLMRKSLGRATEHLYTWRRAVAAWLRGLSFAAGFVGAIPGSASGQAPSMATAPRVTNLAGARDQSGLFTQRLVLPANFCGPIHTHDGDLHGLVLRGILRMGFADSSGSLNVREYPAGSFVVVPAGRRHVEGSAAETEIHLSGIGPLGTAVVDSITPQRCTPGRGS